MQGTIVVAGTVKGNISAASVACANDTCSIEGDIVCDELEMHSGKIKGNIIASNKAIINGNVEGNIDCQSSVETSFGEHAVVNGQYIRCGVLKVEPGAQIAATVLSLLAEKHVTVYRVCKDTGINRGRLYRWLNKENMSAISCRGVDKVLRYLDEVSDSSLN